VKKLYIHYKIDCELVLDRIRTMWLSAKKQKFRQIIL